MGGIKHVAQNGYAERHANRRAYAPDKQTDFFRLRHMRQIFTKFVALALRNARFQPRKRLFGNGFMRLSLFHGHDDGENKTRDHRRNPNAEHDKAGKHMRV